MTPARRTEIHELADAVREALELSPPVDVAKAVKHLGGELKYDLHETDDIEAMVAKTRHGFLIRLRQNQRTARHKFSIAHELGHLFLHMGYLVDPQKWDAITDYKDSVRFRYGYSAEEIEAHEFAGALLMPKEEFLRRAQTQYKGGVYNLSAISSHFGVSVDAARTRGRWLGLFAWA